MRVKYLYSVSIFQAEYLISILQSYIILFQGYISYFHLNTEERVLNVYYNTKQYNE